MTYAGGRVTKRLDLGTWRVDRSPNVLVARSRTASGLRQIAPDYKRITFDKSIATRPRNSAEEATLPVAELCGPGHPLFDALVSYAAQFQTVVQNELSPSMRTPLGDRRLAKQQRPSAFPAPAASESCLTGLTTPLCQTITGMSKPF